MGTEVPLGHLTTAPSHPVEADEPLAKREHLSYHAVLP
jgi:hypothetical protein